MACDHRSVEISNFDYSSVEKFSHVLIKKVTIEENIKKFNKNAFQ